MTTDNYIRNSDHILPSGNVLQVQQVNDTTLVLGSISGTTLETKRIAWRETFTTVGLGSSVLATLEITMRGDRDISGTPCMQNLDVIIDGQIVARPKVIAWFYANGAHSCVPVPMMLIGLPKGNHLIEVWAWRGTGSGEGIQFGPLVGSGFMLVVEEYG